MNWFAERLFVTIKKDNCFKTDIKKNFFLIIKMLKGNLEVPVPKKCFK